MIEGEPEAAPAAAPPSPDDPDAEQEEEEPTGIYLTSATTAALWRKDAATAGMAAWLARRAQLRNALDVVKGLEQQPSNYWKPHQQAQRFRVTYRVGVNDDGDVLDNVRRSIARAQEESPLRLAVAAAELDATLHLEKTARKQAGVSQMDKVTSLLASACRLRAAPGALRRRGDNSRYDFLAEEVRAAGVSFYPDTLEHAISALEARLAREPDSVRAAAAWRRAAVQLPRNDTAANAQLAGAVSHASLGHPETREAIDDDDVAELVLWDVATEHQEALDEWNAWTLEGPSDLATVGRRTRYGHSGTHLGLQCDYRVPVGAFVVPTAESWPRRPSGAPTVVQPASALAPAESLHSLVDGVVTGERRTAWMRNEASS